MDHLLPEKFRNLGGVNTALRNPNSHLNLRNDLMKPEAVKLEGPGKKLSKATVARKSRLQLKQVDSSVAGRVKSGLNRDDLSEESSSYDERSLKNSASGASLESQKGGSESHSSAFSLSHNQDVGLNEQVQQAAELSSHSSEQYRHQLAIAS